jgi:hypothetical protein
LEATITQVAGTYNLKLEAMSASVLLDFKKRSRSFQDKNTQYLEIISMVLNDGGYEAGIANKVKELEKATEEFVLQYEETDWAFINRVASMANASVVPDVRSNRPNLTFGVPEGTDRGALKQWDYRICKDGDWYRNMDKNAPTVALAEIDATHFVIVNGQNFCLGYTCTFLDKKLVVRTKKVVCAHNVLVFTYKLAVEKMFAVPEIFNYDITGLVLRGKVLKAEEDTVSVHLFEIDPEPPAKPYAMQYATPYAANGHAGWYAMPEVEDVVLVHFPTHQANQVFAMNSLRQGTDDRVGDVEIQRFRTPSGRELIFSDDELTIFYDGDNYIALTKEGIAVKSTKSITLNAHEDININATNTINFKGQNGITLQDSSGNVKIQNGKMDAKLPANFS